MSEDPDDYLTRERLVALGRLVFGDRWQSAFARALGYSDRHVRAWASGDRLAPASVERQLGLWLDLEERRLHRLRKSILRGTADLPP